jgi:hypothetical protein
MHLQPRASALHISPVSLYGAMQAAPLSYSRRVPALKYDVATDAPPFTSIFLGPDVNRGRAAPLSVAGIDGRYCSFLPVHKKDAPAFALYVDKMTERLMRNGHAYDINFADDVLCEVAPVGNKWRVQPLNIRYNPRLNEMRIQPRHSGRKALTVARPAEAKTMLQMLQPGVEWRTDANGWQSPDVGMTEVVLPSVLMNGYGTPTVMGLPRPVQMDDLRLA